MSWFVLVVLVYVGCLFLMAGGFFSWGGKRGVQLFLLNMSFFSLFFGEGEGDWTMVVKLFC